MRLLLHLAFANNNAGNVELLLAAGVDLYAVDEEGLGVGWANPCPRGWSPPNPNDQLNPYVALAASEKRVASALKNARAPSVEPSRLAGGACNAAEAGSEFGTGAHGDAGTGHRRDFMTR